MRGAARVAALQASDAAPPPQPQAVQHQRSFLFLRRLLFEFARLELLQRAWRGAGRLDLFVERNRRFHPAADAHRRRELARHLSLVGAEGNVRDKSISVTAARLHPTTATLLKGALCTEVIRLPSFL